LAWPVGTVKHQYKELFFPQVLVLHVLIPSRGPSRRGPETLLYRFFHGMGHKGELPCLSVFLVQKRSWIVPLLCEGKGETSHTPKRGNGHVPIPRSYRLRPFLGQNRYDPSAQKENKTKKLLKNKLTSKLMRQHHKRTGNSWVPKNKNWKKSKLIKV